MFDRFLNSIGLSRRSGLTDALTYRDIFGTDAPRTASGIAVNRTTAETLSAWYAGTHFIAEQIAGLPLITYHRLSDGGKDRAPEDPRYRLLHAAPNPYQSAFSFVEMAILHMLNCGNAYAEIERSHRGDPIALWLLAPDSVSVTPSTSGPIYSTINAAHQQVTIPHTDILHFPGPMFDGLLGESALAAARNTIGTGIAQTRYEGKVFADGTRVGGVLSTDKPLKPETLKWLQDRMNEHRGVDNSHRHLILPDGMKWDAQAMTVVDAELIEARKLTVIDIARYLRLPPHKLRSMESATYASIESEQTSVLNDALMPWIRRIETELDRKLGSDDVVMEFLTEGFLRGSTTERYAAYRQARETGILTINEIRLRENLNPVEGGDVLAVPSNLVPIDRWLEPPPPPPVETQSAPAELPDDSDPDDDDTEERNPLIDPIDAPVSDISLKVQAVVRDALHREMRRALNRRTENRTILDDEAALRARLQPITALAGVPDLPDRFLLASRAVLDTDTDDIPAVWTAAIETLITDLPTHV